MPTVMTPSQVEAVGTGKQKEDRPMQQETTMSQWMISSARRLQAVGRRGGGVGVLTVMLFLPLTAVAQAPLETLAPLASDANVTARGQVAPGDLDTSFGGEGKVTTDFGDDRNHEAHALAIQSDGKLVVAGGSTGSGNSDFALARYRPDGTLDSTFGDAGTVLTDFGGGSFDFANALAIQADGKLVVAGWSNANGRWDFALARYLPNGTLDSTFGDAGTVLTDFGGGSFDFANALAIQADGKLVVAGDSRGGGSFDFALARYLPDGTLDSTFGDAGTVLTDFGSENFDFANALAIQADGKLVVAGVSHNSDSSDFALARYLPNGTLDSTFGDAGKVLTDFNGSIDSVSAVTLQPDGKLVVAGGSGNCCDFIINDFALARYRPDGTLDSTFSDDGKVLTDFNRGSDEGALTLALQPDGKLVVAGLSEASGSEDFALARYLPNGTLDATFGGDGTVLTDFDGGSSDTGIALAIQPRDGRLVVAGRSIAGDHSVFALARYHAITCSGVVVTRVGTASNDTIVGTPGNDIIYGFAGHDRISGLGSHDILCGGTGNDTLQGGSGKDLLSGGPGTDRCHGGSPGRGDTASNCERVTGVP